MTTTCTMILGDCLEVMPTLPDSMGQMLFMDLPFGCTQNLWDSPIELNKLWENANRVGSKNCTAVAAATYRFSLSLLSSNQSHFKYDLIWKKSNITGFLNAKNRPLRNHEILLIFSQGKGVYNPQMMQAEHLAGRTIRGSVGQSQNWGTQTRRQNPWVETGIRYPKSCFDVPSEKRQTIIHSTQKPVALLDWLIRTYSNAGDMVLDPTSGSGTTAVSACHNGRSVTCIEKDEVYFEASTERVRKHIRDNLLDVKLEVRK